MDLYVSPMGSFGENWQRFVKIQIIFNDLRFRGFTAVYGVAELKSTLPLFLRGGAFRRNSCTHLWSTLRSVPTWIIHVNNSNIVSGWLESTGMKRCVGGGIGWLVVMYVILWLYKCFALLTFTNITTYIFWSVRVSPSPQTCSAAATRGTRWHMSVSLVRNAQSDRWERSEPAADMTWHSKNSSCYLVQTIYGPAFEVCKRKGNCVAWRRWSKCWF